MDSLLITAAELHIRADLGIVDAAEQTVQVTAGQTARQAPAAKPRRAAAS